jgi:hypothetical protein
MIWGLIAKNPIKAIKFGLFTAGIAVFVLVAWRAHYLSAKNAELVEANRGFRQSIERIQKDVALRTEIINQDHIDTINNERARSEIIREISNENETSSCGPVVNNTFKRLFLDSEIAGSD